MMEAGSDTSRMTISQIIAAAAGDKRWVERARRELDAVCGGVSEGDKGGKGMRLPEFSDRKNLRYITATVKEGFRWRPFAQIGLPTELIQDDEYEGYRFPKGTLFTWNSMAIALDEREYEQAERFWPERFLGRFEGGLLDGRKEEVDAHLEDVRRGHLGFGPGRRACSGYNVGETNVWIAVARLLYCFDFEEVQVSTD
jgi:cytochrome P450